MLDYRWRDGSSFFLFVDVNILRIPKQCGGDIVLAELAHDLLGQGSIPATSKFFKDNQPF